MTLNTYLNRYIEPFDVVKRLGHFDSIVHSFPSIWMKQHGVRGGKYLLKTPGNTMSLDALVLKNFCPWCKFQSRLLFIIRLLLKNFLTALKSLHHALMVAKLLGDNN